MTQDEKIRTGHVLRVLRQAAGLRQSELATACGVPRQRVHDIEAGTKPIGRLTDVIAAVIAPQIGANEEDVRQLLLPGRSSGVPVEFVSAIHHRSP